MGPDERRERRALHRSSAMLVCRNGVTTGFDIVDWIARHARQPHCCVEELLVDSTTVIYIVRMRRRQHREYTATSE